MTTPVLAVLFRRPDLARLVLDAAIAARAERVYVSIDAARPRRPEESDAVDLVRRIVDETDFPMPVQVRLAEQNLGAGGHVKGAVDWLFENEERGIVLEDDCIPSRSFFPFADAALERYDGSDVSTVAGYSPVPNRITGSAGHRGSRYPMTWGWASWRSKWTGWYTDDLVDWRDRLPESRLAAIGAGDPWFVSYWARHFDALAHGSRNVWDYQWVFSTWLNGGRGVFPNVNLVQNRGFGQGSTHSFFARPTYARPSIEAPLEALADTADSSEIRHAADSWMHREFYRVGRAFPITSAARGVARRLVNRYVRR